MKKLLIGLFMFVGLVFLSACGTNKVNGDYTGKVQVLWAESDVTIRFDDDTVTFINDEEMDSGTYEIDDEELNIIVNEYNIKADISEDGKSFTVTEDDFNVYSGITFTKEE